MTATNHALTGAAIGLLVGQPLLAIPLAFLSHFVLDALPHFGTKYLQPGMKRFVYYLAAEAGACAAIVLALYFFQPQYWLLAAFCAFVAASPDFMWVGEFIAAQKRATIPARKHAIVRLHSAVQWYQKEPGLIVEVAWAAGMLLVLAKVAVI